MNVPTIRIDICIYWVIITVLAIGLFYSRTEIKLIQGEIRAMNDRLANSAIVDMRRTE